MDRSAGAGRAFHHRPLPARARGARPGAGRADDDPPAGPGLRVPGRRHPAGAVRPADGLRFVATDVSWSSGDGPEVSGPGEALALAMVGRTAALDDLTGEGVAELRRRCAREQAGPGSRGRWASAC